MILTVRKEFLHSEHKSVIMSPAPKQAIVKNIEVVDNSYQSRMVKMACIFLWVCHGIIKGCNGKIKWVWKDITVVLYEFKLTSTYAHSLNHCQFLLYFVFCYSFHFLLYYFFFPSFPVLCLFSLCSCGGTIPRSSEAAEDAMSLWGLWACPVLAGECLHSDVLPQWWGYQYRVFFFLIRTVFYTKPFKVYFTVYRLA